MRRYHPGIGGLLIAVVLLGCGSEKEKEGWSRSLAELTAVEEEWNGWKALTMQNGLVTVVTVPAIGGRTMAYNLGQRALLWVNSQELGKTHLAPTREEERIWHNYGGYKTWPAPQDRWGGPGDPLGSFLDGGAYQGEILEAKGKQVKVRVTSAAPQDATGLRFQRTLTLFHGTTRLRVEQTMINISDQPVQWSIWDVTQVPGLLEEGADFSPEARIYFPLNPASRFERGFFAFRPEWDGSPQWKPDPATKLMTVEYQRQTGKIGADPAVGWIAYADEIHQTVLVKRFEIFPEETYPDQGARVEVWTNGEDPYMEVEILSPLKTLQPGEAYTFPQDWYATHCPGPIREVNQWGVTNQALGAEIRDQSVSVRGVFGVFTEGWARLVFRDAQGKEVKRAGKYLVTPSAVFRLDEQLERPAGATRVEVLLQDGKEQDLGVLAAADLTEAPAPPPVETEMAAPAGPPPIKGGETEAPAPQDGPADEPAEEETPASLAPAPNGQAGAGLVQPAALMVPSLISHQGR